MKRTLLLLCCALLLSSLAGCGGAGDGTIPLTDEESEILEMMGEDVHIITDEDYAAAVTELQAHTDAFSGQVYQLEGVYTTVTLNGVETPYVYRTLVHDEEETICGLPLKYLEKELPDGAWARVTAIINGGDFDGETRTVMEVVAVETLAETGQAQLEWDGVGHHH